MRKRTLWIVVGVLLFISVMNSLMTLRNPVVEVLDNWFALIGSVSFFFGLFVACQMEMRLGRFQYQGKTAVWVGLAIAVVGWTVIILVHLIGEMIEEALNR